MLDRREEIPHDRSPGLSGGHFCEKCLGADLEITSLFTTSDLIEAGLIPEKKEVS